MGRRQYALVAVERAPQTGTRAFELHANTELALDGPENVGLTVGQCTGIETRVSCAVTGELVRYTAFDKGGLQLGYI